MGGGGRLLDALRALRLIHGGKPVAPTADGPCAYLGPYPIHSHRTMAQVMVGEAMIARAQAAKGGSA